MNGIRVVLPTTINGRVIVPLAIAGIIAWEQAFLMAIGARLGSYIGAYYVQKLNPVYVRHFVVLIGFAMTAYFFIRDFS